MTSEVAHVPSASAALDHSVAPRTRIEVVLFSGGSGTQSITEALLRHPQISLKILINAYDDGHSTGRLRRFIPGMLGPSDIRKNLNRLMPVAERSQRALKTISDYRLAVGISREEALAMVDAMIGARYSALPEKLCAGFNQLMVSKLREVCSFLTTFLEYECRERAAGRSFDFTDCAIGNLLFAGCYLSEGRDFNRTIEAFSRFHEVDPGILLNVTLGENLFLIAEKESGAMLLNEADIVAAQDTGKISALYLVDEQTYRTRVENCSEPSGGWQDLFHESDVTPRLNPAAKRALENADVIIYGPGTQHSSLFPSYMTEGVAETIAANKTADKIFIGNIFRDFDIQTDDANDIARKLVEALSRKGKAHVEWLDVVSHFFVQRAEDNTVSKAKYVPFNESSFSFPLETVKARDWEAQGGRHSGGYVLDELQQIVQSRIDVELEQIQHMVSVVIPVLNEERTIEEVLKSVSALDFAPLGLTKEIILADGGSTDRTVEIARDVRGVRIFQLPKVIGRGAAIRLGFERARGNIIVFFPGDNEYRAEDLYHVVDSLTRSSVKAVFGTRAVKCTDLSERLKRIYHNNWRLYITSKYGGILLSMLTLILYNRYVTDVLTSIKAFDARLLRSLDLKSDGIDLEMEIVAKLSRRREYMFEVPVDYRPRTKDEGKKVTAGDGLKAILALFRYRLSN
ncbi:MAG TPA: glycosyltransferase [Bryobacteraceae bacterium]|nr:glycosyltransferase [Bryobacteraceae bacterium]